ncbi:MAG: hypothetical protein OXE80_10005, partial [Gammaproteobacteria bacterium]|nr:hypothetical protein [Gammaproteobacteria bacterium]
MSINNRLSVAGRKLLLPLFLLGPLAACQPESVDLAESGQGATPLRARMLTAEQYANTIAGVFGGDIGAGILPPIPPMDRTDGLLASGAAFVGATSDQISQ